MRRANWNRRETGRGTSLGCKTPACRDAARTAVARTKEDVLRKYAESVEEHQRVLRLALNEAEALAWQTDFPTLIFPVLATEKAEATVAWHRRQQGVRDAVSQLAFPE